MPAFVKVASRRIRPRDASRPARKAAKKRGAANGEVLDKPTVVAVKSANRVLDLLELFNRRNRPMSHTDLVDALEIPKSSLSQLLRSLTARGYLSFAPGPNTYELGPAFFELQRRNRGKVDYAAVALPLLKTLTETTGESSSFNLYRKDHVERICGVDSPHALTYRMTIGTRFVLHSSSAGKAVLAALPDDEREDFLSHTKLEARTENTVKSMTELRRQLAKAGREGVAYSHGEHVPGVSAIAVPVRRPDGYPLGALVVAMPAIRFKPPLRDLCVNELLSARASLERKLEVA